MKRAVSIAAISMALLVTGTAVLAVAATAPSGISTIPSIVTQRPIRQTPSASPSVVVAPVVAAAPAPVIPVAPARRIASTLIAAAQARVRSATRVKPAEAPVTIVLAPRPIPSADASPPAEGDHEVVRPKVRDESDDEED